MRNPISTAKRDVRPDTHRRILDHISFRFTHCDADPAGIRICRWGDGEQATRGPIIDVSIAGRLYSNANSLRPLEQEFHAFRFQSKSKVAKRPIVRDADTQFESRNSFFVDHRGVREVLLSDVQPRSRGADLFFIYHKIVTQLANAIHDGINMPSLVQLGA